MAVKAKDQVTLAVLPAPSYVRMYYLKQASALSPPAVPTANPPASPWSTTEPVFTENSTETVYTAMLTAYGSVSFEYGPVQKSTAYEAAKAAYNKAVASGLSADEALTAAQQAQADLDNLQIGGRNYLPWSNHANREPGQVIAIATWGARTQTGVYDTDVPPGLAGLSEKLTAEVTGTAFGGGYQGTTPRFELVGGETYTYSYWAKKDPEADSVNGYFAALNRVADNRYIAIALTPTLTDEWQRFTQTFTLPEDGGGTYQWRSIIYRSGTYWRSHYKLERGNKATDWTPAPEDVDASISLVDDKAIAAANVAANLRGTVEAGLMRVAKASAPPAVEKGLQWLVVDEVLGTKATGLKIANIPGTAWQSYQLLAEDIMVVGPEGTIRLKDGVVSGKTVIFDEAFFDDMMVNTAFAKKLVSEQLMITAGNLLKNTNFKAGWYQNASTTPVVFAPISGPGDSLAIVAASGSDIRYAGYYAGATSVTQDAGMRWSVDGAEKFVVSVWVYCPDGSAPVSGISARAVRYTGATTPVRSTASAYSMVVVPQNAWTRLEFEIEGDAETRSMGLTLGANAATTTQVYFADPVVRRKVGAVLIEDGAVIADKITASAELSAKVGDFLTLKAANFTSGLIKGGFIKADTITADKILIGDYENYWYDVEFKHPSGYSPWTVIGGQLVATGKTGSNTTYFDHTRFRVQGGQTYTLQVDTPGTETAGITYGVVIQTSVNGTAWTNTLTYATLVRDKAEIMFDVPANAIYARVGLYYTSLTSAQTARISAIYIRSTAGATRIQDGAIVTDKIHANAITAGKIATNAVTANAIAADAVTATKIAADAVSAINIAANTITGTELAVETITATEIAAESISVDRLMIDTAFYNRITTAEMWAQLISVADIAISNSLIVDLPKQNLSEDVGNTLDTADLLGSRIAINAAEGKLTISRNRADSAGAETKMELGAVKLNFIVDDKAVADIDSELERMSIANVRARDTLHVGEHLVRTLPGTSVTIWQHVGTEA